MNRGWLLAETGRASDAIEMSCRPSGIRSCVIHPIDAWRFIGEAMTAMETTKER
jgi:hypothetical protein